MEIKRFLAGILAFIFLLQIGAVPVQAATSYELRDITVCCDGYLENQTVILDSNGWVYAPLDWLTYYGLMLCEETEDEYQYYYPNQEKYSDYSMRIFVGKKDYGFSAGVYVPAVRGFSEEVDFYNTLTDKQLAFLKESDYETVDEAIDLLGMTKMNYETLYSGTFLMKLTYGDEKWVPLHQLLPMLGYQIAIEDGIIYMQKNAHSIWQLLNQYDVADVVLDFEREMPSKGFVGFNSYVIDTVLSKWERLDIIWNTGAIQDYETLFKGFLVDNEAYLSAFDQEENPTREQMNLFAGFFKDVNSVLKLYKGTLSLDVVKNMKNAFKEEGFDVAAEVSAAGAASNVIEGVMWLYEYWDVYHNQVEDHRNMLTAVYEYQMEEEENLAKAKEMKEWPSYIAAQNIQATYNTDSIDSEKVVKRELQKILTEKATDFAAGLLIKNLKPWKLTVAISKMAPGTADDFKFLEDAALLESLDNIICYSYDAYSHCLADKVFRAEDLKALRYSALLTLISSKYGYEFLIEQIPDQKWIDKVEEINQLLVQFYLTAEGIEWDSGEFYEAKAAALYDDYNKLMLDDPSIVDPSLNEKVTVDEKSFEDELFDSGTSAYYSLEYLKALPYQKALTFEKWLKTEEDTSTGDSGDYIRFVTTVYDNGAYYGDEGETTDCYTNYLVYYAREKGKVDDKPAMVEIGVEASHYFENLVDKNVFIHNGIHLGMTFDEVKSRVGEDVNEKFNSIFYKLDEERTIIYEFKIGADNQYHLMWVTYIDSSLTLYELEG